MPLQEKKVLVLSEIEEPKFEIRLTPDAEPLRFDPFDVTQKVEAAMAAPASEGDTGTGRMLSAIRLGFGLPDLSGNSCLVLWEHLQSFVMELESTKKLSALAGLNSSKPDSASKKSNPLSR